MAEEFGPQSPISVTARVPFRLPPINEVNPLIDSTLDCPLMEDHRFDITGLSSVKRGFLRINRILPFPEVNIVSRWDQGTNRPHQEPYGPILPSYRINNGDIEMVTETFPREVELVVGATSQEQANNINALMVCVDPLNQTPAQFFVGKNSFDPSFADEDEGLTFFSWTDLQKPSEPANILFPPAKKVGPQIHDPLRSTWWVISEGDIPSREEVEAQIAQIQQQERLASLEKFKKLNRE